MSKDDFVTKLKSEGLTAELTPDSIPIVYVKEPGEVEAVRRIVKKVILETGYDKTFGITALKRKDLAEAS
jgi:hypothetical protein